MSTPRLLTVGIDIRLIGKQRTGDEVVFFQLVRELIRQRSDSIRYELFTDETADDKLAVLRLKLEALGRGDIEIVSLPAKNRFVWNFISLSAQLFRHPVDVFHTQYILPLFLPQRLKVVTHIHDISFRVHPEWIGRVDRFFLSLLIPRTFRRSDAIVVPSEFTRSEILKYYSIPVEHVVVIENAAAEEWFQPIRNEEIERVTATYGLTPGRYYVSSGTMQPRKNIAFLIKAFVQAREQYGLSFPLVLTGSLAGHNVDSQVQRQASAGGVLSVGYLSDADLRALVSGAAAYIFPSLYEGFGIPIEEALAVGTEVFVSDIPVFHEVGRERVRYFDPFALAPLAENLYTFSIDISSHGKEAMCLPGSERLYSWVKSTEKIAQLYRALAATSR
ncbi:MAG: glycosyltransferase family 1 protein [Candidatus Moraniibacteriota bacterium]